MARALLIFLTKDEEDLIHEHSISCLEEQGVLIRSESVLRLLESVGAKVDYDRQLAQVSEDIVKNAIRTAPNEIDLCAREPKNDLRIPVADGPYAAPTGLATYMTDLETGERRNATRADLADFARLSDALGAIDFFWTVVVPMDVPHKSHTVHQLWTSLQNVTKHVQQIEAMDAEDAKTQIELAGLIVGGKEELRERPIFSVVSSPISPMSFEKGLIEAQVELSRAGIPIICMTGAMLGFTSPVTVAGTMNVVNIENLASLVISQAAAEGSPFVYSSAAVPIDMETGKIASGPAEGPFLASGQSQMARRYGLPCMIGGWGLCSGSKPGVDISICEVSGYSLEILAGADLISGFGAIDDYKGASLEQLVIDVFTWENWRPFLRNVTVDEQSIAVDVVREVGQGGTFISHPHTLGNFREALAVRDKSKRAWEATLSDGMVPEARAIAKKILSQHEVAPLDSRILEQGDAIIRQYEKRCL